MEQLSNPCIPWSVVLQMFLIVHNSQHDDVCVILHIMSIVLGTVSQYFWLRLAYTCWVVLECSIISDMFERL